jgi:hypothetical protein
MDRWETRKYESEKKILVAIDDHAFHLEFVFVVLASCLPLFGGMVVGLGWLLSDL